MKQKDFIKLLESENIPFDYDGKIITVNGGNVDLRNITTLPEGIVFNNVGGVYLSGLITLPEGVAFSNGGYVDLRNLTTLTKGTEFNNGGNVYLSRLEIIPVGLAFNNGGNVISKQERKEIGTPYIKRFKVENGLLYKRVSHDFKTQEGTNNETIWTVGSTLEHPNWNPEKEECGEGKFHACARTSWCDAFRTTKGDRYIAIKTEDLHEWKDGMFPQKIAFRKGTVLYECDRNGKRI